MKIKTTLPAYPPHFVRRARAAAADAFMERAGLWLAEGEEEPERVSN